MNWLAIGALLCAVSIVAGAFGAHALAAKLDAGSLVLWETAARYLMYGGLGVALVGLASRLVQQPLAASGWSLLAGTLLFSGTVFALALGSPRWLGAVTPLGGLAMITGFVLLAVSAWRG